MVMAWFLPFGVLLGIIGSHTGVEQRHMSRKSRDKGWWLIILLGWLPLVCWTISQFIKDP